MPENTKLQHSKLVRIDSVDRDIGSKSRYDFKVSTNDFMLHNINKILLKSAIIPNTQFNITKNNNRLYFSAPDAEPPLINVSFEILPGFYNLPELITKLIAGFAFTGITLTVSQIPNVNKMIFYFSTPVTLHANSSIARVIGLDSLDLTSSGINNFISLPNLPDLSGLKKVYIGSHALTRGTTLTSSDKSHKKIFTEVPIKVAYGSIEHRVLSEYHSIDEVTPSVPFNLSSIDFTLFDQDLNIVDLNGLDVQIVLKVFFE